MIKWWELIDLVIKNRYVFFVRYILNIKYKDDESKMINNNMLLKIEEKLIIK